MATTRLSGAGRCCGRFPLTISTRAATREVARRPARPLTEILVEHSSYHRGHLKRRLFEEGLKLRGCELGGQGEEWQGRRMALILDDVNGVPDDNRLENLRIVCPNCAATLDTHCGRHKRVADRTCLICKGSFPPRYAGQRHCSLACWHRSEQAHPPRPERRKVARPPYEELVAELAATSYVAVGRKYGVSDRAVRKWVRCYERARGEGVAAMR